MGRATMWFKFLFGIKKEKEKNNGSNSAILVKNPETIPPNITAAEAAWITSQNKYVAALAAEYAATAATQAAAAAVRINFASREKELAAIKIQRIFRGYLGRKALKGLRAVVKLQALVRGILVRKQAKATLLGMEALIRAQNIVRAKKNQSRYQNFDSFNHSYHLQQVKGRCDDTRRKYITTAHSKRIYSSFDSKMNSFDEKKMGVEVGPARPKSRFSRSNNPVSNSSDDIFNPIRRNYPSRLSVPDSLSRHNPDWALTADERRFSTAHSTPRFINKPSLFANGSYGPLTPANSVCGGDAIFRNYMADTDSFRAKLRCHSAPRQRPDTGRNKRQSLNELMESRNSHSGIRMQRSCSQAQDAITFKNAVMCKLDRSCDSGRGGESVSFSGRKP